MKRLLKPLISAILALLALITIFHQHKNEVTDELFEPKFEPKFDRIEHLKNVCTKYKNPFRTEYSALHAQAVTRIGVEVVHMRSKSTVKPMISLCMPHKVGSHAWGQFSQELKIHPSQQHLSWQVKAGLSIKAVIVRHPLERLLSVYRMIFEDWCDQKRFLAKQWNNVCITDTVQDQDQGYISKSSDAKDFSAIQFLSSMADEHQHGNDRYIQKIWQKFHPGDKLTDPQAQLKFTFGEFVRFLVNGSREFGQDVLEHKGLSYHWAPFWQECSICSSLTQPDVIIHMETFQADFKNLFAKAGYSDEEVEELLEKFPHTHSQSGGHSHDLIQKYFSSLTKSQVNQLYQLYRLDHELFGYHPQVYLDFAQ